MKHGLGAPLCTMNVYQIYETPGQSPSEYSSMWSTHCFFGPPLSSQNALTSTSSR